MPVSREVYSVKVQMVLACIPIIDLWAAYRIEKLRVWLLLWTGLILLSFTINPEGEYNAGIAINILIGFGAALFLMRYLTIEWNRKIKPDGNLDNFT
jgi:hypothetical protein